MQPQIRFASLWNGRGRLS